MKVFSSPLSSSSPVSQVNLGGEDLAPLRLSFLPVFLKCLSLDLPGTPTPHNTPNNSQLDEPF